MITDDELKAWADSVGPFVGDGDREAIEFAALARDVMPRLIAEVKRLQDESRGYWLDAALLEKENTALKAEAERLRDEVKCLREDNSRLSGELEALIRDGLPVIKVCKCSADLFGGGK